MFSIEDRFLEHFKSKVERKAFEVDCESRVNTFDLNKNETGHGIIRIPNSFVKSERSPKGIAERGQHVIVLNKANGKFCVGVAYGKGSKYPNVKCSNAIGIDYAQCISLGIQRDSKTSDLVIRIASKKEIEYYSMFQASDHHVRQSAKLAKVSGLFSSARDTVFFLGGIFLGLFL
jgi:hypothetical protein